MLFRSNTALYRLAGSLSFLVYVQAKRYASDHPVDQAEVFEVQGSWDSIRNEHANRTLAADTETALQLAGYLSGDPVLLVLMTTSRFTGGAVNKAAAIGALLLDGEQIAQLLIEEEFALEEEDDGALVATSAHLIETLSGT